MSEQPKWLHEVLLAKDRLGNAMAGGWSENTVSGRVGYFAVTTDMHSSQGKFWRYLAHTVDWAFEPIDGPVHCFQAYRGEQDRMLKKNRYESGSDAARVALTLLALPVCLVLGSLLRVRRWFT